MVRGHRPTPHRRPCPQCPYSTRHSPGAGERARLVPLLPEHPPGEEQVTPQGGGSAPQSLRFARSPVSDAITYNEE